MTECIGKTETTDSCAVIDAGVCGFSCRIRARRTGARSIVLQIDETQCQQIQHLAEKLDTITLQQLFAPFSRNPVYMAAQQAGCHTSCAVPAAILKTAEVAMEMALPRPVSIRFEECVKTEAE